MYLPFCKVSDRLFHIQGDDANFIFCDSIIFVFQESENGEPVRKMAKLDNGTGAVDIACEETETMVQQHRGYCQHYSQYVSSADTGLINPLKLKRPDHFCDIVFPTETDDPDKLFADYEDLKEVGCLILEVNAGEMLYLPASWFHEVTSYSVKSVEGTKDATKDKGHMALNYWAFPPDSADYEKPYADDFWQRRWDSIHDTDGDADDEADDDDGPGFYTASCRHSMPPVTLPPPP